MAYFNVGGTSGLLFQSSGRPIPTQGQRNCCWVGGITWDGTYVLAWRGGRPIDPTNEWSFSSPSVMSGLLVDRFLFRGFQPKRITTISACAKTYDMSTNKMWQGNLWKIFWCYPQHVEKQIHQKGALWFHSWCISLKFHVFQFLVWFACLTLAYSPILTISALFAYTCLYIDARLRNFLVRISFLRGLLGIVVCAGLNKTKVVTKW